jgi:hypothetical protein
VSSHSFDRSSRPVYIALLEQKPIRSGQIRGPASSAEAAAAPERRSTPWMCRVSITSGGVAASSFAMNFTKVSYGPLSVWRRPMRR